MKTFRDNNNKIIIIIMKKDVLKFALGLGIGALGGLLLIKKSSDKEKEELVHKESWNRERIGI